MAFESDSDQLLVELRGRTAVVTLNRPEARNALSPGITRNLAGAIAWAAQDTAVGGLLLTGAGGAFCSGGDVKGMGARSKAPAQSLETQAQELRARHHAIGGALRALNKPTVAALPGPAAGAGLAIALACDLRLAADSAFLTTGYAGVGLSGDYGIAWLLTRVVGPGRARELLLTGRRVTAAEAQSIGLVTQVCAPERLHDEAVALAYRLANGPAVALGYIKQNLEDALAVDHAAAIDREADRLLLARSTDDHKEAVRAFAEKRKPEFSGK